LTSHNGEGLMTPGHEDLAGTAREAVSAYMKDLAARGDYGRFLTDDVRLTIEGTDQEATGREAVVQTIRFLHEQAFHAEPELKNLVAEAGRAAIEADFVGRHTGEFAGVPATGRDVRVPYSVVYDLDGDRIKAVRIYMSIEQIMSQLQTAPEAAAAGSPVA